MAKMMLKDVRFSYANVFTARAIAEGAEAKYSCTALIDKNSAQIAEIKAQINEAIKEGTEKGVFTATEGKNFLEGKFPSSFKLPIKDGDTEKPDNAEYKGMYFISANSKDKPGVVGTERDVEGKLIPLTTEGEFYSGSYGRMTINFYAFKKAGNTGIGVGLGNLQKVRDGERLSGGSSAWDDFNDEDDDLAF